ncbi:ABC transporter permease [Collinsella ihumii]|uniref:ABC transporter permease n=1 Tax=Collinsella ihumii TaxID=1720204 RepID=A0ABT7XHC2_9ACTN|nr:ABC transporter permease [Collinsella ihumii]MDN0064818.1 ABC transporter permease [Collinsella ihumii]
MNIFTRFSLRSLFGNRTRTIVSIIGIALSCALVCAVLTSVVSMSNMLYERTAADEGSWQVEAANVPADAHRALEGDGRVAARLDVAELGAIQMGDDNAADYGSYLFAKTWPVNPEGERLVTGPEITAGRAPEAPGEIALPHYLEGVELAPCGLSVQGADDASAIELGSTVTAELGERTLRYLEDDSGLTAAGTSLRGTYFQDDTVEETFDADLGQVSGTVVGFYRSYGFSSTRALQGNSVYVYPSGNEVEGALADASDATCVYSILTTHDPQDALSIADELSSDIDPQAGGVATHTSLLRWQGVTGSSEVWNTLYMIAGVLAVVIAVAGVSLVYNSFAISVAERTRQFGLLASLGASKRQLRRTVLTEALLLSAVGIPIGLVLGLIGCLAVFQLTGSGLAAMFDVDAYGIQVSVTVSPAVLGISAGVALATVLVSAWIPALRASRVSAVDAIRQTRDIHLTRRARRALARAGKSTADGGTVHLRGLSARLFGVPGFIAHRNLTRATSKGRVTVAALAVSVALLIISGVIGSVMDYASGTAIDAADGTDLQVRIDATTAEGSTGTIVREDGKVDNVALADALARLYDAADGLEGTTRAGYHASYVADTIVPASMVSDGSDHFFGTLLADGSWSGPIYVDFIDTASWETYVDGLGLSREEFCDPAGPQAIALNEYTLNEGGTYGYYSPLSGTGTVETVSFAPLEGMYVGGVVSDTNGQPSVWYNAPDGSERFVPLDEGITARKEIAVGALADTAPTGISTRTGTLHILLPVSAMAANETLGFADAQMNFDAGGSAETAANAQDALELVATDFPELDCTYTNYADTKMQNRMMSDTVQTFIYCFTVICGLIAVANVFNTLTNSLILRRREFAVLKSIGMGESAFRRMIAYECASYALRGFAIGLALAAIAAAFLTQAMTYSFTTFTLEPPIAEAAAAAGIVLAVIVVSAAYALRRSHAANVVEALRDDAI